jgi:hypothetical protein
MKLAMCIIAAAVIAGVAYALAPDMQRYMKMRSM